METLWDASKTEPLPAAAAELATLRGLGYFADTEATVPPPARRVPLLDISRAGRPRRLWVERGAYTTPDWPLRRTRFERVAGTPPPPPPDDGAGSGRLGKTELSAARADARRGVLSVSGGLSGRSRKGRSVVFVSDTGGNGAGQELRLPAAGPAGAAAEAVTMVEGFVPSVKRRVALFLQAVQQNRVDVVRAFLAGVHGPVAPDVADRFGNTALLVAARYGYRRMTKLLVGAGVRLDWQNRSGNTALHYARALGHTTVFDYLLAHGADDSLVNADGLTCHQYALTAAAGSS